MRRLLTWLDHHSVVFVLVGLVGLAVLSLEVHGATVSESTLKISQLRACHRLNIIRAGDNRSHEDDFKFDIAVARLLETTLTQPQELNRRITHQQQVEDRARLGEVLGELKGSAHDKEWTPLTACYPATEDPLHYQTPTPIKFSQKLPPSSAFHVGKGE